MNNYFRLGFTFALISAVLVACSNSSSDSTNNLGANITPQNISAEYGIPGNLSVLTSWANENNIPAMRIHAWNLWAGMTADSNSTYLGITLPIWETWCGTQEVFIN